MRTSDRTYLSVLGFADPDRHNEIHNAAAIYLSAPQQILKFANKFNLIGTEYDWQEWEVLDTDKGGHPGKLPQGYRIPLKWEIRERALPPEMTSTYEINKAIVQRSSSGYRNIIGYIDLYVAIRVIQRIEREMRVMNLEEALKDYAYQYGDDASNLKRKDDDRKYFIEKSNFSAKDLIHNEVELGIEVKHGFVDVSSVVQQINTYSSFKGYQFILCTLYPVNSLYKKVLKDHNITHIYVDPKAVAEFLSAKPEQEPSF